MIAIAVDAPPACIVQAETRYSVPADLIRAVMYVEGGGRGVAPRNRNGSTDLGWMQINTLWLPHLARYNITRRVLLNDACVNIAVGTWILSGYWQKFHDWRSAVRAYNVGPDLTGGKDDGLGYARRVYTAWHKFEYQNRVVALNTEPEEENNLPSMFVFTPEIP